MGRSSRVALGAVVAVALVVVGFLGWRHLQERAREQARAQATEAATAFLDAWAQGEYEALPQLTTGADGQVAEVHRSTMDRLQADPVELDAGRAELEDPGDLSAGAVVPFEATLEVRGLGSWSYDGRLAVEPSGEDDAWLVDWSPSSLHPDLTPTTRLETARSKPERAPVLDRDGEPLAGTGTTLGRVVGHVDEISEEQLAEFEDPYLPGDQVGQRGLQLAFEDQLAGTPSGEVRLVDEQGGVVEVLHRSEGREPEPLLTTLDVGIQRAAEAALGEDMPPSALVVMDATSSEIRAVVDRPASGLMRALAGQYAPGSTFKVVTAAAALRSGVGLDTSVSCPETVTVGGREFSNFQDMALGEIPFREAIFESCNTAFVQLAAELDEGAIDTTAEDFGFDVDHSLPVGDTIAQYPQPGDLAEHAAAAIGQGRVLATPAHMASVAAAVSNGRWQAPSLVRDADTDAPSRDVGDVAGPLTEAMREVPRQGTAEDAGLPDGVAGKTGTAEVGTAEEGEELATNAWFIGFVDIAGEQLAFAVIVEGGESGGSAAAPVAARLLQAMDGS